MGSPELILFLYFWARRFPIVRRAFVFIFKDSNGFCISLELFKARNLAAFAVPAGLLKIISIIGCNKYY